MQTSSWFLGWLCGGWLLALAWLAGVDGPLPRHASGPIDLRIDAARARADGWVTESATDEEVGQALLGLVRWRLSVMGLAAESSLGDGVVRVTPAKPDDEPTVRSLLGSLGRCEFFLIAEKDEVSGDELLSFFLWREEHPGRPILEYDVDPERPEPRVAWLPTRFGDEEGEPMPVLLPESPESVFGNADFERVFSTKDAGGHPAIGFALREDRSDAFAAFTEGAAGHHLAIVLGGTVRVAPTLNAKIEGGGIIEGQFSEEEVEEILAVLGETGSALEPEDPPASSDER